LYSSRFENVYNIGGGVNASNLLCGGLAKAWLFGLC